MTKYLIIDDEHVAHDIIKGYCDLLPHLELQKNCYDALEALEYLSEHQVDLIFLDLNMPKLKGFDFLRTLSAPPKVIVTTAYSEYALDGYALDIVDYLLKPFGFERFLKAVNKAISQAPKEPITGHLVTSQSSDERIFLKGDKKYVQILIDHVLYMEAAGNYTKVICKNETIVTREKISVLMEMLPSDRFLRVHKSFAVAKKHINSIEGNRVHIDQHAVPIGKMYRLNVQDLLK